MHRIGHGCPTSSQSSRHRQVPRGERVHGPASRTRTLVARNRPGPGLRLFRTQTYRAGSRLVPSHRKLLPRPRRSTLAGKADNPRRPLRQNCAITRSGPSKNHTPEIRNDRESSTSQQFRNNHLHETRPVQPDDRTEHSAPAGGARELRYMAGFEHDDLGGRIIDLGTGTGRLAIGAALMGARETVGVDMDERALALAKENVETAGVIVEWVHSDIEKFSGRF